MSGTRVAEREFRGHMVPTDAHDNTLMLLDFGDNLFALAYGTPAGSPSGRDPTYYGTAGVIAGANLNGQPIQYPGREIIDLAPGGSEQWLLPHVVGAHRAIDEAHVFEDIMQLVDWVREGKPSPASAEHARHVIEIIEAAYRAAETGQSQKLTTTLV
jgi:predicted dehydrogenase